MNTPPTSAAAIPRETPVDVFPMFRTAAYRGLPERGERGELLIRRRFHLILIAGGIHRPAAAAPALRPKKVPSPREVPLM